MARKANLRFGMLSIAADGRGVELTKICRIAGYGTRAPMDVLWFRCRGNRATRRRRKGVSTPAASSSCSIVGLLAMRLCDPEGSNERVRAAGLDSFRDTLRPLLPVDKSRADDIKDWEQ